MKIVVIGATGTIGTAVVSLLQSAGHQVVPASRSTQPSIDITSPSAIDAFFSTLGEVDAIITVAGDAAYAPLPDLTDEQVVFTNSSKLAGQVNVVRKGHRHLTPNGKMVITGGMLAYAPLPETALITMVNAGLEGFAKAATLDLTDGKEVLIVHPPWLAETAAAIGMDPTPWPDAATVAKAYLQAVEGKEQKTAVFIPGYEPL